LTNLNIINEIDKQKAHAGKCPDIRLILKGMKGD